MQAATAYVVVKGKGTATAALSVGQGSIVATGSWLKIARIFDEDWLESGPSNDPTLCLERIRESRFNADLFTFGQPFPDVEVRHPYYHEPEILAAAPTSNFQAWWDALPQESRKNVRKSQKRGVVVRPVPFDDQLVHQIKGIYDECPYRQGRRFWHYGKELSVVRQENATYLERSEFIGAYLGEELIGFIKLVYIGSAARIMQILAKNQHYDKHPMNALLTAAVEACARRGIAHLIYAQYIYGNKRSSSVTEFKRRNGFQPISTPRYFIPLTLKGRAALGMRLHRPLIHLLPERVLNPLLEARSFVYNRVRSAARA